MTEWHDGHGAWVSGDAYTKLARYEDTGLEPEEVQALIYRTKELCPCRIGDTVYVLNQRGAQGRRVAMEVIGIEIGRSWTLLKVACHKSDVFSYLNMADLGKKFFFADVVKETKTV